MDSFELNKIFGAVFATGLLVMALSITSEIIYEPEDLRENGYVIAVAEGDGHGQAAEAAAAIEPIAVRLQVASVSAGESSAKKCQACHTFEKGGPPKVGPNLYGIVEAPVAHASGFNYSDTFKEKNAEGMQWTFADLDAFLTNPKADMPGTLMAFAGLKKPDERANVIAYLRTLADSPVPLPEPPAEAAAAEGEAAAAAGEAATADGEATQGEAAPAQGEAVEAEADAAAAESEATAAESEAMSAESEASAAEGETTAPDTMTAPEAPAAVPQTDTMAAPPAAEMPAPAAEMPPMTPEPTAPATQSAQ